MLLLWNSTVRYCASRNKIWTISSISHARDMRKEASIWGNSAILPECNIGKGEFSLEEPIGPRMVGGMAQLSTLPLHPLLPFYFPNFFCKPDTQFPTDRAGRGRNMTIDRWLVRAAPMKSIEKSSVTRLGKVLGRESATLHPSPKRPSQLVFAQ